MRKHRPDYRSAPNRLSTIALNAASPPTTMGYAAIGNVTSRTGVGSYTYHSTKKHAVTAAGGNTYAYDANGNMTTRNGASTTWYSYNLPDTISNGSGQSSQFYYGAYRNRWKQVAVYSGTETTIYVGGLLEKVTSSAGTGYRHYIPAGSTVAVYSRWSTGTNTTHYIDRDHLGSTSTVTDSSGAVTVRESFDAFGARRDTDWSGAPNSGDMAALASVSRRGYTMHEHLDNLNLIHMNGRVYDPAIGRFMSADPYVQEPFNAQNLNRFSYALNNPLAYTDPSGFNHNGVTVIRNGEAGTDLPVAPTGFEDLREAQLRHLVAMAQMDAWWDSYRASYATIWNDAGVLASGAMSGSCSGNCGTQSVGEMIDANAMEAASRGDGLATYGWAFFGKAWEYLGAESISQLAAHGSSDTSASTEAGAALEIATVVPLVKVLPPAVKSMAPVAGKITGYTKHGLNQAISRDGVGVSPKAILDAVRSPEKVIPQANGATKYVGKDATVILNREGKVITTYPRGSAGTRNPSGGGK